MPSLTLLLVLREPTNKGHRDYRHRHDDDADRPHGQRALVTAGTRGIGKGITDRLRAAGATVVVAARTAPHTPSPQVITADIATVDGSATIAERTLAILGSVDIVVHNVGGAQVSPGSMTSLSDEDFLNAGLRTGVIRPTIDKVFTLDQIVDAHRYLERGQQVGKVVATV